MKNLKGRILYAGQSYYHGWFISREIRKLGWVADLLNFDPSEVNQAYYFGEDHAFKYTSEDERIKNLAFYFNSLSSYDLFHFNNMCGLYIIEDFDSQEIYKKTFADKILVSITLFLLRTVCKWRDTRVRRLAFFIGMNRVYHLLKKYKHNLPERWDILLLKRLGKKIVYGNNGCQDGVLQSSFRKWSTPDNVPVCDICPWRDSPEVCSDEKNLKWAILRNSLTDYQLAAGGNRVDYNDDPQVHDLPWWGCLDQNMWNPDLIVPSNYLLPFGKDVIKIYHSVGDFESRARLGNKTIKSTHIYFPLIEELKKEGHQVELIFFHDIPIKKIRYYQAQADIVVDMLTYGYFGANVREGMMMGKPCICYLRPEWLEQMSAFVPEYVDELPVISATPATIKSVLVDLIENPEKRIEIGKKSREFAVKWHSPQAAARELDKIYIDILHNNP